MVFSFHRAYQSQTWYVDEAVDRGIANPETPLFWISTETRKKAAAPVLPVLFFSR